MGREGEVSSFVKLVVFLVLIKVKDNFSLVSGHLLDYHLTVENKWKKLKKRFKQGIIRIKYDS